MELTQDEIKFVKFLYNKRKTLRKLNEDILKEWKKEIKTKSAIENRDKKIKIMRKEIKQIRNNRFEF
jgi:hypothetical protein